MDEEEELEWEEMMRARNSYKRVKCDAVGWTEEKGLFMLMLYRDSKEKLFYAKLDAETVKRIKRWCDEFLGRHDRPLEGYQ